MLGTFPMSDSPTPTIATLFFRDVGLAMIFSSDDAAELGKHRAVASILERDAHAVANRDLERLVPDDVGEHPRALIEIDERYHIRCGRSERRRWRTMHNAVTVNPAGALALDPFEPVRPAVR